MKVFKVNAKDLSFLEKKLARQWSIVSSTLSGRITQTWRVYGSSPTDALGQALWANFLLKILLRVGFRAAKYLIKKSLNKVYIFFSVFLAFFFLGIRCSISGTCTITKELMRDSMDRLSLLKNFQSRYIISTTKPFLAQHSKQMESNNKF